MMKRLPALLLIVSVVLARALAAEPITTIELQHRPAEDIMPIVKPMLGPDDALSGQGFKLFLRASPETAEQVRQMVAGLDTAARMLLISVFQGSDRDLRALGVSGELSVESGDAGISIGNDKPRGSGGSVHYGTGNASAGARVLSTRGRLTDNPVHRLRVTEGTEGYIETGEQIPYFSGTHWIAPGTAVGGIDYKDVTTGFYVLPRVHGDQVTLHVSPFKQAQSRTRGGDIDTQRASTTISGPLGEWLPIGGTTEQTERQRSGIGQYRSTRTRNNESIWIKADPVN